MNLCKIGLLLVTLLAPGAISQRPDYSFGNEPFELLPEYPEDLQEVKKLFETNTIPIQRVPEEYYLQPEFYPSWYGVCEKLYGEERKNYGVYGFNIYPSLITSFCKKGDTFNVSALVNTGFGVQVRTGTKINLTYNSTILDVQISGVSTDSFLLNKTFPAFELGWSKPITLSITVLENINTTVIIKNEKPSIVKDKLWRNLYGLEYSPVGSLVEEVPSLTVEVITPGQKQKSGTDEASNYNLQMVLVMMLVGMILTGVIVTCVGREK